ncbi:hypothetical protein BaRGS_00034435, partial [Batillaria attramentaria]
QALYQSTNPEYLNYIYLISPISLLLLNPIGFTLMEIHRHRSRHALTSTDPTHSAEGSRDSGAEHGEGDKAVTGNGHKPSRTHQDSTRSNGSLTGNMAQGGGSVAPPTMGKAALQVAKGVLLNPIVFMTAIGIAGNFIFHQKVPSILDDILEVLGNAFSASALFYLGLSMVGKVQSQVGMAMVVPVLLIFAKSLLLPLVTWEVVGWLQLNTNVSQSLSMYGFLYGTFPSAPSVILYATHYGMAQDTVATGMVAGTFLSAPLMFVSAKMMTVIVGSETDYRALLFNTSFDASIIGIVCSVWVLGILVLSGRWRRVPHRFTICLLLSQLLACIGMVAYREKSGPADWRHYAQFVTLLVGVFASRCWTAALALALCLLHVRSLCFVLKSQVWLLFLGFGLPVLLTGLLFLVGAQHISDKIDPSFHYGFLQTVFSAIVLAVSLLVTLVSIVLWQRNVRHASADTRYTPITTKSSQATPSLEGSIQQSQGSPISPGTRGDITASSPQRANYQACAAAALSNCSEISIEDIVPFSVANDDSKSVLSDGSCTEDHGLVGSGGSVPMDERTCLLGNCNTQERLACRQRLRRYAADVQSLSDTPQDEGGGGPREALQEEYQSTHHLLLLLLLSVSMFVGLFLCLWKIFNHQVSGIYVEIEFLDSVFNYGQAFLVFIVFGFDTRLVFSPVMRRLRRWLYGAELVHLPKPWELDEQTQTTCRQFLNFHAHTCKAQICSDRRFRFRRYENVFTGAELCEWLMGAGLAGDQAEAVAYGRRLLLGRVIAHCFSHEDFLTHVDIQLVWLSRGHTAGVAVTWTYSWCGCHVDIQLVWLSRGHTAGVAVTWTYSWCGCHVDIQLVWLSRGHTAGVAVTWTYSWCGCHVDIQLVWLSRGHTAGVAVTWTYSWCGCHVDIQLRQWVTSADYTMVHIPGVQLLIFISLMMPGTPLNLNFCYPSDP